MAREFRPGGGAPGENRRDLRFSVSQAARLTSNSIPGRVLTGFICDISRHGMQLMLEQPAPVNQLVKIRWNGREIDGSVRHQQEHGSGFRAGVELSDPWSTVAIDVLAQQAEELRQSNLALQMQTAALQKAEQVLEETAGGLRVRNQELADALKTASQASAIKSRFLASVSHEFRTPLNGIIGFSELLYDAVVGPVTSDQKECLADILTCSRHLLTLISQVLDLTKIESGKMDFEYEEVDLGGLSREVMDGVKGIAAAKEINMQLEVDLQVRVVRADAARLRQLLFNYLSNALKFTPVAGSVVVKIMPHDDASYRIQVTDTGPGIRAEDQSLLFIEFSQLGAAEKAKAGTGLGLAITRRIVEAQGGRVGVNSSVGTGSTFWAVLPNYPTALSAPVG